jgi:hypothetical protein
MLWSEETIEVLLQYSLYITIIKITKANIV